MNGEGDAYARRNATAPIGPKVVFETIASHLGPQGSLIELGCGDGNLLVGLRAALGPRWHLTGVDPSHLAVERARHRGADIEVLIGTADDVPTDARFDAVLLGLVMMWVDRALLFRTVAEVDRLLALDPSGDPKHLFIFDFDPPSPSVQPYRHRNGLCTWKMDYSTLFLANPDYHLLEKREAPPLGDSPWDRRTLWVVERRAQSGYVGR